MNQTTHHVTHCAQTSTSRLRLAVVCSSWHSEIVHKARDSLLNELSARGWSSEHVDLFDVPGAFEIPLYAKRLARTKKYCAIIACGFVVDGGIYQHEFVSAAVINALMQVQLETDVPVFSAVLTPKNFHEHGEHQRFFAQHMETKGAEVAAACMQTLDALKLAT